MRLHFLPSSCRSAATVFAIVFFLFLQARPVPRISLAAGPRAPGEFTVEFVGRYDDGDESAIAIAVQGNYAYIGYERPGNQPLVIVDVADPAHPAWVGEISFPEQIWDVKVSGGYAYVANDSGGLRIIDISNPAAPREVGHTGTSSATYGVAVAGNEVYIADGSSGLRVVNVNDPANPIETDSLDTAGSAYDVVVAGGYAYLADGANGLLVIDIAVPSGPVQVGRYFDGVSGEVSQVVVAGGYAYLDGIRVIDVSYPRNPVEVEERPVSFCEDIFVAGDDIFVADGYNGLQILDIANPLSLRHSGFYATDGYTHSVAVAGDYVYLADAQDGLIIVRASEPTPTPTATRTPTQTLTPAVTFTPAPVYLPLTMKKYIAYFEGPWESEPNNDYQQANGPLRFDTAYTAYPNDSKDYFSFYLFEPGALHIDVLNHSGDGVQVLLYDRVPVANGEVARVYQLPYHIEYNGKAGWYYVYVYTAQGHNNSTPYTLQIHALPHASARQADRLKTAPTLQP
ncbi:MAG: LVIVD repeat-containing protein [Chloroflexota bacterium]